MATTVNTAFAEFLRNEVNLDSIKTKTARTSRDNLLTNIYSFSGDIDFFSINKSMSLNFGSFARHTKLRPLDDIDLMVCISGSDDRKYSYAGSGTYYMGANQNDKKNGLNTFNSDYLNSTKVINRFISKLSDLNDYSKAEMHKNQEAATLKLKSYSWNFDIVPCFYCDGDFYLIPDGKGNWKKTDPRIDNKRVSDINQVHDGHVLELVRLVKYWNRRRITTTVGSYLLECMILNRYENKAKADNWWIDAEFRDTMYYLSSAIYGAVNDPKGIQGDLNTFSFDDRGKISSAMQTAYEKSRDHFPELWEQLKAWDNMTWRNFRADYSVQELEKRFDFEEEWQKAGKPLRSKAFYSALKNHLASQTGKEDT